MTTYTIEETAKEIRKRLEGVSGSSYFTFEVDSEDFDKEIRIRVSDHSCKHTNNKRRTLSFCTTFVSHSDANPSNDEWIVNENGVTNEGLTIEKTLEWELE